MMPPSSSSSSESPRRELAPVQVLAPLPATPMPWAAYDASPAAHEPPGLLALLDNLLQHARVFLLVLLAVLACGVFYLAVTPPVWQADALVQIDSRSPRPLAPSLQQNRPAAPEPPSGYMLGELEILRSREIVAQAIAKTGADLEIAVDNRLPVIGGWYARSFGKGADAPLAPPLDLPLLDRFAWGGEVLRVVQIRVPRGRYGEPLLIEAAGRDTYTVRDEEGLALARGRVGETLGFELDGERATLRVAALAGHPGTRWRVVPGDPAAVYDSILKSLRVDEAGRQSGVIRASFVDTDPAFARAFLDALTTAYLEHHLKVRSAEASRALAFLDSQLPVIKRELDRAEEALDAYRTGNATVDIGRENENALRRIADLERERTTVELKRHELATRFTPQHPQVQALQQQLSSLAGELLALRGQMRQAPRHEKDVGRLQREVQVNSQLYLALLNNAHELRVSQAGMTGIARLVDPAGVQSQPVRPRPGTVLSIASGLGLVLALAAVLLARVLRPTLRSADDLEQHTGIATLAAIPESARQRAIMRGPRLWKSRLQQRLLALRAPAEPAVEGLRALRNSVALRARDGGGNTVLVTAATTEAGKSFVAANLAVLLAAADRRVLLVDLDLRAPRLHSYFGIDRDRLGLADVLDGRCTLDDAIVRDVLPGLDVLLTGHVIESPGELLLQPRFEILLDELKRGHAQVVIDSAPVLPVGDTLALARLADSTVVVVRSEANTRREVRDAIRRIEGAGGRVDGMVLNGVKRGRLGNMAYRGYYPQGFEARG